jgi:putative flippase GtrA
VSELAPQSAHTVYERVVSWAHSHKGRKLIRFTLVSGVTTVTSFTLIAFLYGLRIIPDAVWATLVGNILASVPAYQLNRRWTWGKHGRSHLTREIIPFWSLSLLGIGVALIGADWARHEVRLHRWSHLLSTATVSGTNLASFAIFWVLKIIVFNRIFRVDPSRDIDRELTIQETQTLTEHP